MPIYDFGYRVYDGPLTSQPLRWLVIARQGVHLALRGKLLRRLLLIAWTPMLYFAVVFFMIGGVTEMEPKEGAADRIPGLNEPGFWEELWEAQQPPKDLLPHHRHGPRNTTMPGPYDSATTKEIAPALEGNEPETVEPKMTDAQRRWMEYEIRFAKAQETMQKLQSEIKNSDRQAFVAAAAFLDRRIALRFVYDAPQVRSAAWTTCFYYYVDRVQITLMVFVIMIVVPPLVSNDLRGRSFLIYFSSAVTKRDYVIGKLAVVMTVVALVTILPGMTLYVLSIAFSPSIGTLADTIHVALRMLIAVLVVGIPASLGSLYLSARTTHPRFAAFTWIAIWLLGAMFYSAVVFTVSESSWLRDWAFLLSPSHTTTMLSEWIFGVRGELEAIGATSMLTDRLPERGFALTGLLFAILLSVLSGIGIQKRITAPMSV